MIYQNITCAAEIELYQAQINCIKLIISVQPLTLTHHDIRFLAVCPQTNGDPRSAYSRGELFILTGLFTDSFTDSSVEKWNELT